VNLIKNRRKPTAFWLLMTEGTKKKR